MPRKSRIPVERTVALVYIRQSFTKDENDKASPERQLALAEARVAEEGWQGEIYLDVEGHKSARFVNNRPGWLEMKQRLADPDVVALVAYDLARLHRKGWRIGDLLDQLDHYGVQLVFTRPGYNMDTSTRNGKFMAQIVAMLDEAYAEDVSQRTKAAVAYLRAQGKSVGATPFGTVRNEEGFLKPSDGGAWFIPETGQFLKGAHDEPLTEGAVWRSYYLCAGYILQIFAENQLGLEKIAYRLNEEGWPFRDRKGNPRPVSQEDVRRVVANWPEYGGLVPEKRAKDRSAYDDATDPSDLIESRAVFPLELLEQVALVRKQRSREPVDTGIQMRTRTYPLRGVVYCAHCEAQAKAQDNPGLRTRLTGALDPRGKRRYKHMAGVTCGVTNRTVPADDIEAEVGRLLKLLTVREDALEYLTELAMLSRAELGPDAEEEDLEQRKREEIALCQRRIDAAVHLYGDGRIAREEYLRRVEENERQIVHWQARTTESERKALELSMCIEAVNRISSLWDTADDEDRQGMVQYLFTEIVFDLDTRRIVSYKLKPWADDFLMLRMELYYNEFGDLEPDSEGYESALEKARNNTLLGCCNAMPHRGFEPTACFDIWLAAFHILEMLYDSPFPTEPQNDLVPEKAERNAEIRARYEAGESVGELATAFGISEQRVSQIIHGRRN